MRSPLPALALPARPFTPPSLVPRTRSSTQLIAQRPHGPMSSPSCAGAFGAFDDRLLMRDALAGVVVVRAPEKAHGAILAHAARRLRCAGHRPIEVARCAHLGTPVFREAASQLGVGALPTDPKASSELIAQAALAKRAVLIVPLPEDATWDRAVASELARRSESVPVIFVTSGDAATWDETVELTAFDLGCELTADEKRRWMNAVADDAQNGVPGTELSVLEGWWSNARCAAPTSTFAFDMLSEMERHVLCVLALAGRSLPVASLATFGDGAVAASRLVAAGLATGNGDLVALASRVDASAFEHLLSRDLRIVTARILTSDPRGGGDPWADARAAELLLVAGEHEAADAAMARAIRNVDDGQASDEISRRWFESVMDVAGEAGLALRRSAAQRSLDIGEANEAQRWCESAMTLAPEDPGIALLMGRVLVQLGDLVAARVYLQKAQRAATSEELYASVVAELAEVSYHGADLEQARAYANTAIALATTASTRLAARNTLGKIHLGAGEWDVCDEHFADDATTAHACGDRTAELRARVNRGIALLSKGALEDARAVLERVLEDGARCGVERARASALHNLAVIAEQQHDYGRALEHWEASARFPVTLCGRISAARLLCNLADLRLRLGLVDHAEHAIAFGRRVLGARTSTGAAALFAIVAARIALARGNTTLARREVDRAVIDAERAGETGCALPDALLVSARVALADGDVHAAAEIMRAAEPRATSGRSRTELALLKALHLRAAGRPSLDAANEALATARASGHEDLLVEIHTLLGELHRDFGDASAAQAHCSRGFGYRDQIASGLTDEIRAAFLGKEEICALGRLRASIVRESNDLIEEASPSERAAVSAPSLAREIIGDHPQIRSLMVAIKKVARSSSMVLIHGESGTGKELVADALHRASDRAAGPLVSVNCAALVETLLLSELFGHEKGAFTGAGQRRRGRFELAEGGTLFLDEIGDISARTQVALLRVLQEKTFERVGGTQSIRANVRVICATHRDLKAMVERGEFREDLFYRLRGITLEVPPLRARLGDVPKLAQHLLARIALERSEPVKELAPEALELLQRHRWPGNIRELENVLRAAALFAEGEMITASDLVDNVDDLRALVKRSSSPPPPLLTSVPAVRGESDDEGDSAVPDGESLATEVAYTQVRRGGTSLSGIKRQIERDCIARALSETNGNITHAAALLGVKRPRLSQLVKQYRLAANAEVNK